MPTYLGLSAADFRDINLAAAEAMAYVVLPVTFLVASPASSDVDSLYGEATTDDPNWRPYGSSVRASIKFSPTEEELTRFGLHTGATLLGFIPRQSVLDWQTANAQTWSPKEGMLVVYNGARYNITQLRTDWLPVGDGTSIETLGHVFTATTKPAKTGA
jgi:hypothetical protein